MDATYVRAVLGFEVTTGPPIVLGRSVAGVAAVPPPPEPSAASRPAKVTCAPSKLSCPACFVPEPIEREGHPPWFQPRGGHDAGLRVTNSLTGEKESFIPIEGKKVRWYTCGPTVYDVAHMGHARAYLTFDILRRVMANWFGYELSFQINITDIDDKIILRARQNKLFEDFSREAEKLHTPAIRTRVAEAMAAAEAKLLAKRPKEPPATAQEREKQEFVKLLQEHELKFSQHTELCARVAASVAEFEAKNASADARKRLLSVAREPLSAMLDKEQGHTVSDQAVFDAHARHFENEYFEDMDSLGILRPDIVTRITDYMDGRVQRFIEKLEEIGVAYESRGSVYFSIDDFKKRGHTYRKLVPAASASAAEMAEGEGALAAEEAEKRNANDFALWKKSKPGEPAWPSKWGAGRPGWHIECSVMALDKQGEFLDIHAGGEDLKFPHHDNEQAQSEAYLCRPQWTNYFWHAGHLHIEGLKMSKSLKNFITIRQALEFHSARQLRMMFLMQPWDRGMNYSDQAIDMARVEERKMKHFFGSLAFFLRRPPAPAPKNKDEETAWVQRSAALDAAAIACETAVDVALRDNFATGRVIEAVSKLVSECQMTWDSSVLGPLDSVVKASAVATKLLSVLGVEGLGLRLGHPAHAEDKSLTTALDAWADLRQQVRQLAKGGAGKKAAGAENGIDSSLAANVLTAVEGVAPCAKAVRDKGLKECADSFESFLADLKAWAKKKPMAPTSELLQCCDEVRDRDFAALGVRLEDRGAEGFVWMFEDPEVLAREAREQAEKAAAASRAKITNRLTQKRQELKATERAAVVPEQLFRIGANAGLFSAYDEVGVPTKLASGEEVSQKKRKDFAKEIAKQQKDYEKLLNTAGGIAKGIEAAVTQLREEVDDMEKQLQKLGGADASA